MGYTVGQRVLALSHVEGDTAYIFGHGVFEGRFLPPETEAECPSRFRNAYLQARVTTPDMPEEVSDETCRTMMLMLEGNPRIKLDNGKTVWGYECWWGTDEDFQEDLEGLKIVEVDIDDAREKARQANLANVN